MKKYILGIITGLVIAVGVGVIAYNYNAKDIEYNPSDSNWNVNTVGDAIDSLKVGTVNKFCELKNGNALEIGSMYECDPGDGTKRNFYLLDITGNKVELLMERNITDTLGTSKKLSWSAAMTYFRTGAGAGLVNTWKNVIEIDLPKAQSIVDATGRTDWIAAVSGATWWCFASKKQDSSSKPYCNATQAKNYNWLYDYTYNCNNCTHSLDSNYAYGYWTRDLIRNSNYVWYVESVARLTQGNPGVSDGVGVRPVITILKSNIK